MPVESKYDYIDDLNPAWPNDNPDQLAQQATQSRGIKSATKGSFPNLGQAAVTGLAADLNAYAPIGSVMMFAGTIASLPANWNICDGTNGTVDLTDRFVYGTATQGEIGDTGGSADAAIVTHTHTADHDHPAFTSNSSVQHSHAVDIIDGTGGGGVFGLVEGNNITSTKETGLDGDHTHTINVPNLAVATSNAIGGVSGTDANLPPYLRLAFIQRIT